MTTQRYRRLPGRRRGIFGGASVWAGSDHLLAVRSMRFRENYKRFYLRDVQAIAVARQPRFHFSTRAVVISVTMFWTYLILRSLWDWADVVFWSTAGCLAAGWALVSAVFSCRCRIYTAVSHDELPSVYRTWTARKFLAKVEPLIVQAQGTLDGDWTEVVEPKGVGPAHEPAAPPPRPVEFTAPAGVAETAEAPAIDKTAGYIFIATLLLDVCVSATMRSQSRISFWAGLAVAGLRVAASIWIIVQRYRRRIPRAMQTLAIVSLVSTGLVFYAQQLSAQLTVVTQTGWPLLTQLDIAVSMVLAAIGMAANRSQP